MSRDFKIISDLLIKLQPWLTFLLTTIVLVFFIIFTILLNCLYYISCRYYNLKFVKEIGSKNLYDHGARSFWTQNYCSWVTNWYTYNIYTSVD